MNAFNDSSSEDKSRYVPGGYHPVQLGEIYNERYIIINKLGFGHFCTAWMGYDLVDEIYVAIKFMRSAKHYTRTAYDEIEFHTLVRQHEGVPGQEKVMQILDHFFHQGPNGKHMCMVFELLGMNIRELLKRQREGIPLPIVKEISRQVLEGLDFLHGTCKIIHTDLKPDNVMTVYDPANYNNVIVNSVLAFKRKFRNWTEVKFYDNFRNLILTRTEKKKYEGSENFITKASPMEPIGTDLEIKIGDLGNGEYTSTLYSGNIETREYRSPEIILGLAYNETADIFSFACMFFKIATGHFLFYPKETSKFQKEDDHLRKFIEILGEFPLEWARKGRHYKKYFDKNDELKKVKLSKKVRVEDILVEKHRFDERLAEELESFLLPMMEYLPERRATAFECLQHSFFNAEQEQI